MSPYTAYRGDCLEIMPKHVADKSINLILADLPYGTTNCAWDVVIPFKSLWAQYKRVLAPGGCVVLFGNNPFSALLISSNLKWYKHDLVWNKNKCGSPGLAPYRPMRVHEDIMVFSPKGHTYNPQMEEGEPYSRNPPTKTARCNNHNYGFKTGREMINTGTRYPKSILNFPREFSAQQQIHPTQKSVELCRWLIRTYSNPGDKILDNAAGSMTIGVAAIYEYRSVICIELDEDVNGEPLNYFEPGVARMEEALVDRDRQPDMFAVTL